MERNAALGAHFENEIREQPGIWRELAQTNKARTVADAVAGREVLLIGSGSSLFVAQLGAIAMRSRGVHAHAVAATEAAIDHVVYSNKTTIVCSQSGKSTDVLDALDVLRPSCLLAITNTPDSPLGRRADICIDAAAGVEFAVPASKTVTVMAAILMWAAALLGSDGSDSANALVQTANAVEHWLDGPDTASVRDAAARISTCSSVVIVGSGFGLPIAFEFALKMKEASYVHAEGFAAGEFRHGSAAMIDSSCAIVGILDERSDRLVRRALSEASMAGALGYVVGQRSDDLPVLGPVFTGQFDPLAWLVTGQVLALYLGRARGVQSDAPRGLVKALL
ncbi:MAG TPA: SIS domain-containing protein [Candidatus Baltobacteraceae bacterium]|jgi:glucosamine--fructose-6-phosphate aminotransferase (isomerizing)|nr:SIS domain-containing protein [Candidatus Baltobacteraceae bacterium]